LKHISDCANLGNHAPDCVITIYVMFQMPFKFKTVFAVLVAADIWKYDYLVVSAHKI
jgi:hypothetical protein